MVKELANVSMYVDSYREVGGDSSAVPFGRIKREDVAKAMIVLQELVALAAEKAKIENKRKDRDEQEANEFTEELQQCSEKIYK